MFSLVADCRGRGCRVWLDTHTDCTSTLKYALSETPFINPQKYLQSTSGVNIFVHWWMKKKNWESGIEMGVEGSIGTARQKKDRKDVGSTRTICQLKICQAKFCERVCFTLLVFMTLLQNAYILLFMLYTIRPKMKVSFQLLVGRNQSWLEKLS